MSHFSNRGRLAGLCLTLVATSILHHHSYAQAVDQLEQTEAKEPPAVTLTPSMDTPTPPSNQTSTETTQPLQPVAPINQAPAVVTSGGVNDITIMQQLFPDSKIQTVVNETEMKGFLQRLIRCEDLQSTVVIYTLPPPNATKLWMTASKDAFCRVAILPYKALKPVVCNLTMQDVSPILTQTNIDLINNFDPAKNKTDDLLKVGQPLLNCYKKMMMNQDAQAPAPSQPVNESNPVVTPQSAPSMNDQSNMQDNSVSGNNSQIEKPNQPGADKDQSDTQENYNYSKMLQQ